MTQYLVLASRFWPLLLGGITFVFTLGMIWQQTQTSLNGVKKLFTVVDKMTSFMESQSLRNEYLKEKAEIVTNKLLEHDREDRKNFTDLIIRVDQMYKVLSEKEK